MSLKQFSQIKYFFLKKVLSYRSWTQNGPRSFIKKKKKKKSQTKSHLLFRHLGKSFVGKGKGDWANKTQVLMHCTWMAWAYNEFRECISSDLFSMASDLTWHYDSGQG